jgi:hypothetical protein
MDAFRFCPELFEVRTDVLESLGAADFQWLTHYSSVDPLHDVFGIEVCGIREEDDARTILALLQQMFPAWRAGCLCFKDYGREPGYKARVFREEPREREQWETAE